MLMKTRHLYLRRTRMNTVNLLVVAALAAGAATARAGLHFKEQAAERHVTNAAAHVEHAFPFTNTGSQTVTVERCILSCASCTSVRAEPSVVPPKGQGRVILKVSPKRGGGAMTVVAHVLTDEGVSALQSLRLTVVSPEGPTESARAAARLAKRPSAGLERNEPAGFWRLTAADIWFDAADGEKPVLEAAEREVILNEDFPVGKSSLRLRPDRTFQLDTGRHRAVGKWSVKGDTLPLNIEPPGCTNKTCWKVWALEAVTAETDRLVVDLPDEDEGSPRMLRLAFKREERTE